MAYQDLYELISLLEEKELAHVKKIITATIKGKNAYPIRLIEAIEEGELTDEEKVISEIYSESKTGKEDAFKKLVSRTQNKLIDAVIFDLNEDVFEIDEIDKIKTNIMRKAGFLQVFQNNKSKVKITENVQGEIINQCISCEYYSLLVDILHSKLFNVGIREGEKGYLKLKEQINYYENCRDYVFAAFEMIQNLKIKYLNVTNYNIKELVDHLERNLTMLNYYYEQTRSDSIKYIIYYHEYYLFLQHEDYGLATNKCVEMLELLKGSKSVKRKSRFGIVYSQLSACEINCLNFNEALQWVNKALQIFQNGSRNSFVMLEQSFLCNFYLKNFNDAQVIIKTLIDKTGNSYSKFEHDRLQFYSAYCYFAIGQYKEALRILTQLKEVTSDKSGIDINARLLIIVINIQLKKEEKELEEVVTRKINCLKKHIQRNDKETFSERDLAFIKILFYLHSRNFEVPLNDKRLSNYRDILRQNHWDPFSAELIPYEELTEKLFSVMQKRVSSKPHRDFLNQTEAPGFL